MTSRERVINAIEHKGVDRTPRDFWAEDATLERLFHYVGHRDLERILQQLQVDMRHLNAVTPKEKDMGGFYENFWGERFVYRKTGWGLVREDICGALSSAESFEDIKNFNWPSPDLFDYSTLGAQCKEHHPYALLYGFADIWQRPCLVRGLEQALMDHVMNPEFIHFMSRKYTDFYKDDYARAHKASNGRIDLFLVISDLGGQTGPLISAAMFEEFVAPYLKEITDHIHNLGAKALFHSCGMIHPFIHRLIDLGIDVLDPIQPASDLMQPERLAKDFAGKICFHGGIDVQKILPYATPQEVKQEVRRYQSHLATSQGGYICCSTHLLQPDNLPENIFAMYQAIQ